jgi:hypothetical protein
MIIRKRKHIRMPRENGTNGLAHLPNSFAVDNSDGKYIAFEAGSEVIPHQVFDITWAKRVQIQDTIDR